jgi:alkylmercury lyase
VNPRDHTATNRARTITPAALARELAAATPRLSEREQHLFLTLYRLLAAGEPIDSSALAESARLPVDAVRAALERLPGLYTDDRQRVIGFWGLSIRPMPHQMTVNGQTIYGWCAWDTLFLPELLAATAEIQSRCPTTGQRITLTVEGTQVTNQDPAETVLSFLHRDQPFDADTIRSFCHYVHFFANPDAAANWTADREGTFTLSLDQGSEIARLTNRARFPTILAD